MEREANGSQPFIEKFDAGSQGENAPGEVTSPSYHESASNERDEHTSNPYRKKRRGGEYRQPKKRRADKAFGRERQRSPETEQSSVEHSSQTHKQNKTSQNHEGGFVFVNPLPDPRSPAGREIVQRMREARHGGKDHSPGPNNPSDAKNLSENLSKAASIQGQNGVFG